MSKSFRFQTYNEDAFDWLERRQPKSIQAIVTDPPFGVVEYSADQLHKKRNGKGGIWRLPHNYDGSKRSPTPRFTVLTASDHLRISKFYTELAAHSLRVLVPGAHVILASQNILCHFVISAFLDADFEFRGQVARVVKTLRGGDRPKGAHEFYQELSVTPRSCWEPWLIFRKACEGRVKDNLEKWGTGALRRPAAEKPFSDLILSSPARGIERKIAPHPSLKPQAFVRQIVRAALPLGKGIVLDPFMGSGAIVAASLNVGYRAIGLEIDAEYFELAQRAIPTLAALSVNGNGASH